MASINRIFNISKGIGAICGKMLNLQLRPHVVNKPLLNKLSVVPLLQSSQAIHTTIQRLDVMEFFDDPKNWGQDEVKHGRAWSIDELRIKSNVDLHKLWFVLLKERNMLLTMELECNDKMELFPSPERIDKVNISMENLENVVRERNRAYHLLETGEDGERPQSMVWNQLGMRQLYRQTEHLIPKLYNKKWREAHVFRFGGHAVSKFRRLYKEKYVYEKQITARRREVQHVKRLLRRYPNISKELIAKRHPNIDLGKILHSHDGIGHYAPNQ
ncbi:39S ribosomal protein L47, mitochondrial [Bradysia coprophila]|uniref:39S ribosomal protein L47, mitochondrial n=1 Tax=Bradysia coprophila TaxID=38358 RepID=UPI00187DA9C0|nr:39S ribosomal protein L47, mitochondrial [Bradysia coprophila]